MARTLNEAFSNATAEILIKTDCDPFVRSRGAIGELMTNFGDKRVSGATGICVAESHRKSPTKVFNNHPDFGDKHR